MNDRERMLNQIQRLIDNGRKYGVKQLTEMDCFRHRITLKRLDGSNQKTLNQCEARFRRTFAEGK